MFNFWPFKNKKTEIMNEQKLMSYMQNFTRQKFQWIKTDRPELIGKVVTCTDIIPNGQSAIAKFDDGSTVDVTQINNKLMMIMGDTPPLSKDEVQSLYSPPPKLNSDPNLKPIDTSSATPPSKPIAAPAPAPIAQVVAPIPVANPFEMFNSDETDINLKLSIKMPDKKLLKLMYNNAEDKELFLEQLSNYVHSMINNTVVLDSISAILVPKETKKAENKKTAEITITQVGNEEE